jgi:hypothetical protein
MSDWAKYWAVDLHVHTPGSEDAKEENFGTADEIVRAAIDAGLDAIAITDHNTASWVDQMSAAAAETDLIVLPGVEISTTDGHLLAIWEIGTAASVINELLVELGIKQADRGKLDIATNKGLADAAKAVVAAGGLAIAAHVDKPKGLLEVKVKAHMKRTLLEDDLCAVELVHLDTIEKLERILSGERRLACVRSSDAFNPALSAHSITAIGSRRTWVKASRPDLIGIRHALNDPDLRISLSEPESPDYPQIDRVELVGGFLDGQVLDLCPDLNCLLGGTGAGKSLVLEAIRYALDQQCSRTSFPAIRKEVDSRLSTALGEAAVVRLQVRAGGRQYKIERVYSADGEVVPTVFQHTAGDWVEVDADPSLLVPLAAFSQGEILEYSREQVGRMTLVDSGIDLAEIETTIDTAQGALESNADQLVAARARVEQLKTAASKEHEQSAQVRQLSELFDTDTVKAQEGWTQEDNRLKRLTKGLQEIQTPAVELPSAAVTHAVEGNEELFSRAQKVLKALSERVDRDVADITAAVAESKSAIGGLRTDWNAQFDTFKAELDVELAKVNPEASLVSLRGHLESLQRKLMDTRAAKEELDQEAQPALEKIQTRREGLIQQLHDARASRRELRRTRVAELNKRAAGFVKLDIPDFGDYADFRAALNAIKVGSHVRDDVIESVAKKTHPLKFVRAMWDGDLNSIVDASEGIDLQNIARLQTNIMDRSLWTELLAMQGIDRPDVLKVSFRKPDDGQYTAIENLAHGQRCTAILVTLLADGSTPVLVDQPEDALHAPWIEEYLVDRLRSLRGSRQYIFATRSPGIVVSGDAEQIITMQATAGRGEREASGSLERHDLNRLALYHLEGGPIPFTRRMRKLKASVSQ